MVAVSLPCGRTIKVDECDLPLLSDSRWVIQGDDKRGRYVYRGGRRGEVLHRVIMGAPKGLVVDHINGDTLDNRRSNLRVCTNAQNLRNQKPVGSKGAKGVCWRERTQKYRATICLNYKRTELGGFETENEAALAYDIAALRLHGDYARLNFNPERDWLFPYPAADKAGRIARLVKKAGL